MSLNELMAAAFCGDIEAVNKNIHLLFLSRVRYKLMQEKFLDELQKKKQDEVFEICIKAIKPSEYDCERFLLTAITQENFKMVEFLVSERKTNINLAHLKAALKFKNQINISIAHYLIKNKNDNFVVPPHELLSLPGAQASFKICSLLVDKFNLLANKNDFIYAIDRKNYQLFSALLCGEESRLFCKLICENNIIEAERHVELSLNISTLELEMFMLLCAKQKKFNLAGIIAKSLRARPEYSHSSNPDNARPVMLFWQTNKNLPKEKYEAIKKTLKVIFLLLSDGRQCINLLYELDQKIAEYQNNLNVDFSKIIPQDFVMTQGMKWPIPPVNYQSIKSYSLLKVLMRESLMAAGIECSEEMTTFCWFVERQIANQVVSEGRVFKEHHLFGNVLYHGLLTHFIQIYLIKRAIEIGIIPTSYSDNCEHLSLQEILNAFIDFTFSDGSGSISFWEHALDKVNETKNFFLMDFTCPEILNQALFWTDSLPHLRGYWVNNWYRKIEQYLVESNKQNPEPLTFETMILLSAIASPYFASFNPFKADTISDYYSSRPESLFNKETLIATKPWAIRYQFWQPIIEKYKREENILLTTPLFSLF